MSYLHVQRPTVLAVWLAISATAHAALQDWGTQVGTTWNDRTTDMARDPSGDVFLAGSRFQLGIPDERQAFIVHLDSAGQVDWTHELGSPGVDEYGYGIALDGAGGAALAGWTAGDLGTGSHGGVDTFVARYDAQGQLLWLRQYGSVGAELGKAICSDGAGGYFLTGVALGGFGGGPAGQAVSWVTRLDSSGNPLWTTPIFAPTGTTEPNAIARDGAGGLYVCGWTSGSLAAPLLGSQDGWVARLGGAGNVLWIRQYGGGGTDGALCVAPATDQGAFLGGSLGSTIPFGSPDGFLRRYRPDGGLAWSFVTQMPNGDEFMDLVPSGSGGVFASGSDVPTDYALTVDAWYASYSGLGAQEFLHHVGNPVEKATEIGTAIDSDGGAGLILAGWTAGSLYATSAGADDVFVAHYDDCELDPWEVHCASNPNSTGKAASIGAYGSAHVASDDFTLVSSSCPSGMLGLFLMSSTAGSTPFGNGALCLGGSVLRLLPVLGTSNPGAAVLPLDLSSPPASQITPGSTWHFQFWFRDIAAGGAGFNLSNGLRATFCP